MTELNARKNLGAEQCYDNEMPTDSISYKDLTIYYENRLRVKPSVLYKQLQFTCGELYSLEKQTETQLALSRLGIFRYTDMQYMPTDSSHTSDTMNVQIYTSYDYYGQTSGRKQRYGNG